MTDRSDYLPILDACRTCGEEIGWIECPTGGWWEHTVRHDDHDAQASFSPGEDMDTFGHWSTVREGR